MRHTIVCLLLLGACAEQPLEVEFAETPLTAGEMAGWSAAGVRSAHHEISVRRTIVTPSWCRDFEADVVRTASDVTLRIHALETQEDCPPGEGMWGYLAEIRGLKRGRYNLRVVHTFVDRQRPSELVLTHPIVVE